MRPGFHIIAQHRDDARRVAMDLGHPVQGVATLKDHQVADALLQRVNRLRFPVQNGFDGRIVVLLSRPNEGGKPENTPPLCLLQHQSDGSPD
ncbi:MAG: hypothetical protein E2O65_13815 [Gammaproteobacteria bacterium]|nr:MAG: hypothetical protein E2O65_13815 [Gammaproteobacteria bacterium]